MLTSAPRLGVAALALVVAAALMIGPLLLNPRHPAHKARGEVSIAQLVVDHDTRVAPAADGEVDTVTVQASR
jgi:hypothetical protein